MVLALGEKVDKDIKKCQMKTDCWGSYYITVFIVYLIFYSSVTFLLPSPELKPGDQDHPRTTSLRNLTTSLKSTTSSRTTTKTSTHYNYQHSIISKSSSSSRGRYSILNKDFTLRINEDFKHKHQSTDRTTQIVGDVLHADKSPLVIEVGDVDQVDFQRTDNFGIQLLKEANSNVDINGEHLKINKPNLSRLRG